MKLDREAKWIGQGADTLFDWRKPVLPAPLFRYEFTLPCAVARSTLYICGLGYHELRLNGAKVGDHVLDPIVTQYDRRVRAVRHDIGERLAVGNNVLGVMLGNGWYNCHTPEVWHFDKASWRDYPKLILWLTVTLVDGTTRTITSGPDWKVGVGPVRFDALRNGETYDARMERAGWDLPGFDETGWTPAVVVAGPGGVLEEQISPPCKVMETLTPVSVTVIRPGVAVYDLGQNMAGWAQLRVEGKAGDEITLRYGERLKENGEVDQEHIGIFIKGGDVQTDRYILKGEGVEIWEPRFTYHGFQYIQVEGLPGTPAIDHIRGRVVHTSFESIGTFESGDADLNRLQECTRWSYLGNFVGIPTDCPQREKNGWTGDAQLAAETGLLNFGAASSYRQWLETIADTQRPNGQLPGIVPSTGWGYNWGSGPAWDNAFLLIPWYLYLYTGDSSAIVQHYEGMKRYMDFCASMATGHLLSFGLGDWCAVDGKRMSPAALTSTAYYYVDARLMARCAALTGRNHDAEAFGLLAERIRTAFNTRFYQGEGIYGQGEVTSLGCALYQGLVEDPERSAVVGRLVDAVTEGKGRVDFGILGAKYIPRALAENGHVDLAYRLITQPEYPGWVHWLRQGATTLWENWNGESSRNHIMFGDISAWMYHFLAGICPDPQHPGFRHVRLQPHLVSGLEWVRASHRSPHGLIASAWERKGKKVRFSVSLPAGVTGELILPDGEVRVLQAGKTTCSVTPLPRTT